MKLRDHKTGQIWEVTCICAKREGYPMVEFDGDFDLLDDCGKHRFVGWIGGLIPNLGTSHKPPNGSGRISRLEIGLETRSICIDRIKYTLTSLLERVAKLESTTGNLK